jgi:hypothetical protein
LLHGREGFFFLPQFCDVAEVVIINKDDLARFGYILHMKVEEKTESFYILGYLLELIMKIFMAIWNRFPSKFGQKCFHEKMCV